MCASLDSGTSYQKCFSQPSAPHHLRPCNDWSVQHYFTLVPLLGHYYRSTNLMSLPISILMCASLNSGQATKSALTILCRVQLSNKRRSPPQKCPVANNYHKHSCAYLSKYGMRHIPPQSLRDTDIFWTLYDKETSDDLVSFLRTYGRTDETLTQVV